MEMADKIYYISKEKFLKLLERCPSIKYIASYEPAMLLVDKEFYLAESIILKSQKELD